MTKRDAKRVVCRAVAELAEKHQFNSATAADTDRMKEAADALVRELRRRGQIKEEPKLHPRQGELFDVEDEIL